MTARGYDENGPLRLSQMLEEEYQALHGQLPDSYLAAKQKIQSEHPIGRDEGALNEALLSELYRHIQQQPTAALCLSGGGIRSATFGLGVLQGLARRNLLDQFQYLSTVSGGGYVGSWLTSWICRKGQMRPVLDELKSPPKSSLDPEPKPIRHLREYSNYLTPQLGPLSADTWTLIATYLRNLFINWLVWFPLVLAVLILPRLIVAVVTYKPNDPGFVVGALAVGLILVGVALAYICLNLPSVRSSLGNSPHFFRHRDGQGSFLMWCLVPLMASAFSLTTAWAWLRNSGGSLADQLELGYDLPTWIAFPVVGMLVHVLGWLVASALLFLESTKGQFNETWQAIRRFSRAYYSTEFKTILISGLIGGIWAWVLATKIFPSPSQQTAWYACFAAPLILSAFLVAGAVYIGLASRWTSDEDREWWARSSGWMLIASAGWAGASVIVVFGPVLLFSIPGFVLPIVGGTTGLVALVLGVSAKTKATEDRPDNGGWQSLLLRAVPVLAAPVAIVCLATLLVLLTNWILQWVPGLVSHTDGGASHLEILRDTNGGRLAVLMGVLASLAVAASCVVSVNKFSLHSIYRNRLIRAYLGASNETRDPNPFTGFDPQDNIPMHKLAGAKEASPPRRLLHVVNIALNLVGKDKARLAWQERQAESFTVSPLHVGNWQLGYRRSENYGQSEKGGAISLGTAVGISGAAASPNMGYHSSPAVTLLMTLFNVRLGWWLGNPGKAGQKTFRKASPTSTIFPMLQEAFGFTTNDNPYVYLSDGGHFENLGLYEMVLRRCRLILVVDAGRDPECTFEDLGNAIRKVRIDFGIPITLQKVHIYARNSKIRKPGDIPKYCAIGTIAYSRVAPDEPDGTLIYLKPALCENEPLDIYNYAQINPGFPHESTSDQWFSESQFESYRMLGSHILEEISGNDWEAKFKEWKSEGANAKRSSIELFATQVRRYLADEPSDQGPGSTRAARDSGEPLPENPLAETRTGDGH